MANLDKVLVLPGCQSASVRLYHHISLAYRALIRQLLSLLAFSLIVRCGWLDFC